MEAEDKNKTQLKTTLNACQTFWAAVQIDATIVTIEVNCSRGIKFYLVGLPDSAVKESHERIVSVKSKRIQISCTTNSSQHGSSWYPERRCLADLPLAIGILAANGNNPSWTPGRLPHHSSLDGSLQPIKGALLSPLRLANKVLRELFFRNRMLRKPLS